MAITAGCCLRSHRSNRRLDVCCQSSRRFATHSVCDQRVSANEEQVTQQDQSVCQRCHATVTVEIQQRFDAVEIVCNVRCVAACGRAADCVVGECNAAQPEQEAHDKYSIIGRFVELIGIYIDRVGLHVLWRERCGYIGIGADVERTGSYACAATEPTSEVRTAIGRRGQADRCSVRVKLSAAPLLVSVIWQEFAGKLIMQVAAPELTATLPVGIPVLGGTTDSAT